ncbi:MAG: crossover junction endodeoxyribonuclease RuvC [Planctomycetes bacterium]|nr:crossover junction endodeoxyribonuclease RuvC [Planctomycetota bacterium]
MATFTRGDITLRPVAVVRILGIDPGTLVVGYGCLEVAADDGARVRELDATPLAMRGSNVVRVGEAGGGAVRLVAAGVLRLGTSREQLPRRLLELATQFADLVRAWRPDEVAIEEAFYGKSVQAALRIGEARGVVLSEAARAGVGVHQYPPARVKRCVTGNGAARKQSVASMLGQLIPQGRGLLTADLPADASDAVAVAWTRLEERRSPLIELARSGDAAFGGAMKRRRNGR